MAGPDHVVPEIPEPKPMVTPEQIRGIAANVGYVTVALVAIISFDLFLLCAVVALVIRLVVLHAQRDEMAAKWADELFRAATAEHQADVAEGQARLYAGDYDAVVKRLAEVLDEHALCPAPVEPTLSVVKGGASS